MDPVPYNVQPEDVDEVLSAYDVPETERADARAHVMKQLVAIDEVVRAAPESTSGEQRDPDRPYESPSTDMRDFSQDRRETALAAIEDVLIKDGYVELRAEDARVFPVTTDRDSERND